MKFSMHTCRYKAWNIEKVFTYVEHFEGRTAERLQHQGFARHHDQINAKMTELKNIIYQILSVGRGQPAADTTLFDIFICEGGFGFHNRWKILFSYPQSWSWKKGDKMKPQETIYIAVADTSMIIHSGLVSVLRRLPDLPVQVIEVSSEEGLKHCMEAHTSTNFD